MSTIESVHYIEAILYVIWHVHHMAIIIIIIIVVVVVVIIIVIDCQ